jgi:putative transposase
MDNIISCKYCLSQNVRKYGLYKDTQHYFCNDCRREFSSNDKLYRMKTPSNQVSSAIDMYYKGMSVNDIRDNLNQQYGNCPSSKTIYAWVQKYTNRALDQFKDYHPQVGDVWIADETVLRIAGQNVWMYDIIDTNTRYLLATQISTNRTINQSQKLMEAAQKKAGKTPKLVITDSNNSYPEGIERAYGGDTIHVQSEPFADFNDTQLIERFHSTLKDRTKVMRGLKSIESANKFIDGWLIYYNYLRPHESLDGKTPAEKAKVDYRSKSWVEINHTATPETKILVTPAKVDILSEHEPIVRPITHRHYDVREKKLQRKAHRISESRSPRITQPTPKLRD